VLPRISHYYYRLVDVHREVGVQVLAGAGDLVYWNRVTRNLAGIVRGS